MARQKKPTEGVYSAGEAIRKLRMPQATFHNYVKTGKIKKITLPGRTEGFYEKAYIDKMAEASELFAIQYAADPAIFSVATTEDAQGIYDVIASLWGTLFTTPVETRKKWYTRNPKIDYVVKQEGVVTGYATIMPLKHEVIEQLMTGKIRGWDIKPEDILPFEPGIPLECYTGIAVRAGVYKPEKYGMRLMAGLIKIFQEFAEQGIFIKRLYAVSDTPDGIKLSRDLSFEESSPAPGSTFKQYILDTETSNLHFVKEYRESLAQHIKQEPQKGKRTKQKSPDRV